MARIIYGLLFSVLFCKALASDPSENEDLFEGDIELNPEQKLAVELAAAGVPTFGSSKFPSWPKVIPYDFHPEIAKESRAVSVINEAIAEYHKYTCLRFRRRQSGDEAYLYFNPGRGCSSPVGYWRQPNNIKLAPGCWYKGIVMHEMMHSLGFFHEQSRPDRDSYVTIHWENIPQKNKHNFKKYDLGTIDSLNSPYDYDSVMHYGRTAFGSGRVTIEPVDPSARTRIGQRKGFSRHDIYQLNKRYKC